jgi:branched-chain amino acid transport system ATP-binding protein
MLLKFNKINVSYGRIQALRDVSLDVDDGEIVAVVGANGAGKTTLLKALIGLHEPESGMIKFAGIRIEGRDPDEISKMGIAYVPEGGRPFRDMSIRENLEMGAYHPGAWKRRQDSMRRVFKMFPRLEERQHKMARTLSGGERQMLAISRALMSRPSLCVFDEPSIGLAPLLVLEFFRIIQRLRDDGITILLIEQNVKQSLEIADRGYVLENGRITMEGSSRELLESELIRKAYLGL